MLTSDSTLRFRGRDEVASTPEDHSYRRRATGRCPRPESIYIRLDLYKSRCNTPRVWLERLLRFWAQHLDALGAELTRGKRERRRDQRGKTNGPPAAGQPTTNDEEDT